MAAPGQNTPGSRRDRLREHFKTNPGRYRATEVAKALGEDTQPIANELARMARRNEVRREALPVEGRVQPLTLYSAAE